VDDDCGKLEITVKLDQTQLNQILAAAGGMSPADAATVAAQIQTVANALWVAAGKTLPITH
jgi:hypothetical protein